MKAKKLKKLFNALSYLFLFSVFALPTEAVGRKISMLELPPVLLNFKFLENKTIWLTSEEDFKKFWTENSRNAPEVPPTISIDWKTESLLAVVWKSEDSVVRQPAYLGIDEVNNDPVPPTTEPSTNPTTTPSSSSKKSDQLRLRFSLLQPCFGIITDQSPIKFMVVGKNLSGIDGIEVTTENSKQADCFLN